MPVLGFNRTGLRMAWLRKEFSPCNIHIDRDPRDVRASYMRQMEQGNYTFFAAWLRIAEENAAHPVFAPLVDSLPIRKAVQKLVTKPKSFYRKALDEMEPAMTYFPVFYMWVASALHALSYCDLVFDMEHAAEKGYAASRSDMIRAACGLDVNFDDVRTNRAGSEERNPELEAIEQQVLGIFPIKAFSAFYNRDSVYVRLPELSRRKAGLLKALL
jgi:hypothetical protein